ncbi:hypothetical protein NARC_150063 [Candidatus Nitrosocosmicus arcticus]|uniref:Uncharacterized protein n=1 Tax=Candidatus Nitrosocosmicus arcticus TaxID=2035267 RepID=A0A557SS90_9ARCH|nr:hypothetical protein NARC_150054 [Candidatus Nitrosocosmicus arcticus]TVP39469.1 hypothetical protein NARC_150063 [Candidatus Nitrosocosmicus arcticus]
MRVRSKHPVSADIGIWNPQVSQFLKLDDHIHSFLCKKKPN